MAIGLGLMAAVGVFLVFWGLRSQPSSTADAHMIEQRLRAFEGEQPLTIDEMELRKPFSERVVRPWIERFGGFLARHTPEQSRIDLQNKLNIAGRPGNLSPSDFQALRFVAGGIFGGLGLFFGLAIGGAQPLYLLGGALVGAVIGFFGPVMWLRQKVNKRRKEIQLALPDAMDLLTIAVEAGLGFDAAMARVTEKFNNALSEEFGTVLQETRLGRPRLEALDDMGRRSGVEDLHNFVQAVIQSEQMGVGIAKILRIQSDEIRRKRRQKAQEKAAQASLKMMLPMVGCIFPTLWIVLLGPSVLILLKASH
jgi:tight adherence protein C